LLIDAGAITFGEVSVWTCESHALFQGGGDRKVVNFEQILFANGRMLDLTEVPAQRVRAFNFDRIPSRVSVALAPKHVERKEPLMQLPSILQGESRTRLLQGAFAGFLATVVIGFGWGGWTLGSTARENAAKSAATAVVAILAPMCADKFRQAADASANMAALKKVSSWMQDSYIEKGGWATFPGMTSPDRGVAQACATLLTAL
jgi:hypothetical protein